MRIFKEIVGWAGRVLLVVVTVAAALVLVLFISLKRICSDRTPKARDLLVTTLLETGNMKFLASWLCSDDVIADIVARNTMETPSEPLDTELIHIEHDEAARPMRDGTDIEPETWDENGMRIEEISGRAFLAKMLIVKDPSQVRLGTIKGWGVYGEELDKISAREGAAAAINGGIFQSDGSDKGGMPIGVVVQDGRITHNAPREMSGLVMIGFNTDDILIIKDISAMTEADFETYAAEAQIRDAVAFQDEMSGSENHFTYLVTNGVPREVSGAGGGANPRSAIGQRADGAVLLLVTDGRGAAGHLGATAADLIGIMQEYGAVNAANLDGGASSTMMYNGQYEMTSTLFNYYQNKSWRIPTAFVVMPREVTDGTR